MDENPDEEQLEAIIPNEELELDQELDDTEDVEELKEKLAKKDEFARQALARAKKAEAALKEKTSQSRPVVEQKPTQPASLNVEETVLLANGMAEELVEELKLRAPKYGGSLIKAQADPYYVAVKEQFEKTKKQEQASMPASRASGSVKPKKDFKTPGLTEAERKQMFEDRFNR